MSRQTRAAKNDEPNGQSGDSSVPSADEQQPETNVAELLKQLLTQQKDQDQRAAQRAADLTATLQQQAAESARLLEERLEVQLRMESERTRTTLREELETIRTQVESTQREAGRQREELDGVSRRVADLGRRQDAVEASWTTSHRQVSSELSSVQARVDAVQRELYDRISVVQSRPSSVHVDEHCPVSGQVPLGGVRAKPNSYDGKVSFPLYRTQFDMVAELNHWSDTEKARYLATSLQGQALTVLNTLSAAERVDYHKLTSVLTDRFNHNRSAELSLVKLDNRKRLHKESLQSYSADIEQLVLFAYPTMSSETRDVMTRDRFLRGLDSELRKQIKLARPANYIDTLNVACEIESVLLSEAENIRDRSDRRMVRKVSTQSVESESENESSRYKRDLTKITCYNCRQKGHFKSKCPEPLRDSEGRSRNQAGRKRRHSNSDSRRRSPSRSLHDSQSTSETRDETIARLRVELDKLSASGSSRTRHASEGSKNSH